MPEAFLRHLRVNAREQELRSVGVAQVVEPDGRNILHEPHQPRKLVCEAPGVQGLTIVARAH